MASSEVSSERISSSLTNTATNIDGSSILAQCLLLHNITVTYGVVGIPIVELAEAIQATEGLTFISCRNEQTSSYAASIHAFVTGNLAVSLTVAGPGVVHGLAGIANAWSNRWPLIAIAALPTTTSLGHGGFQEAPQAETVLPYVKYSARITSLSLIPSIIRSAAVAAVTGRPGPVYIEIPAELVTAVTSKASIEWKQPYSLPVSIPAHTVIAQCVALMHGAVRPLIVIGKGAAYSRAEHQLKLLVDTTHIPFIPTPMGKGVISDSHPLNMSAARTSALQHADVILIVGARLNWQLHYGEVGRFAKDVKILLCDIASEDLHSTDRIFLPLIGDATATVSAINTNIKSSNTQFTLRKEWIDSLTAIRTKNESALTALSAKTSLPLMYYRVFRLIRDVLPADVVMVSEGANTMDISRTMIHHTLPRCRLDAGTMATMGLGAGYAICAGLAYRNSSRRVITIQGDSAFGFSAADYETAVRYKLPIAFIILNNSGIYYGSDKAQLTAAKQNVMHTPVTSLTVDTRYDLLSTVFGGRGYLIHTEAELTSALTAALKSSEPSILNIIIAAQQGRKRQTHSWMSKL